MKRFTEAQLAQIMTKQGHAVDFKVPKKRAKRSNEESQMQQALIRWWSWACKDLKIPEQLLMSIPNGGKRDAITGSILKREGARAGAPDLVLFIQRDIHGAMLIELKKEDGFLSPAQVDMQETLRRYGFRVFTAFSLESAKTEIISYISLPK